MTMITVNGLSLCIVFSEKFEFTWSLATLFLLYFGAKAKKQMAFLPKKKRKRKEKKQKRKKRISAWWFNLFFRMSVWLLSGRLNELLLSTCVYYKTFGAASQKHFHWETFFCLFQGVGKKVVRLVMKGVWKATGSSKKISKLSTLVSNGLLAMHLRSCGWSRTSVWVVCVS